MTPSSLLEFLFADASTVLFAIDPERWEGLERQLNGGLLSAVSHWKLVPELLPGHLPPVRQFQG